MNALIGHNNGLASLREGEEMGGVLVLVCERGKRWEACVLEGEERGGLRPGGGREGWPCPGGGREGRPCPGRTDGLREHDRGEGLDTRLRDELHHVALMMAESCNV